VLRLSSPSQWRDRAGFSPDFPDAQSFKNNEAETTSRKMLCQVLFRPSPFIDPCPADLKGSSPQSINQNTKGIVKTEKKVLRITMDAARSGS
jgi:hypothetical protein